MTDEALILKFKDFYKLEDEDQQKILNELLHAANNLPENFKALVQSLTFDPVESPLPFIYEAMSKDLIKWSTFFTEELIRIFKLAKASNEPKKYLTYLNEFSFINPVKFKDRERILEHIKIEVKAEDPIFRYYALTLLADFHVNSDSSYNELLIQGIEDPDWHIRYWSFQYCQELDIIPKNKSLALLDKIRARLFNTIKYG